MGVKKLRGRMANFKIYIISLTNEFRKGVILKCIHSMYRKVYNVCTIV